MDKLLLLYFLLIQTATGCPYVCSCKWKGGKEWVECASRGLQGLPSGAREETQVLDLSKNQLLSLLDDYFFILRLINLQKLYLSHSHIQYITAQAFRGLLGLVELDLAYNELKQVPTDTFVSVGNLMRLSLAGNPLEVLHHNAFYSLSHLSFLDLSHCRLSLLESGAFAGLHTLEWLRLNDNLLTNIPQTVLPLSKSLHGLPIYGNPWRCDCQLGPLHDWLKASKTQISQEMDPSCAEPLQLKSRSVWTLKTEELACMPKVRVTNYMDIYEGENVTLHCEVQAIPEAIIRWLLNGESLDIEHDTVKDKKIRYNFSQQTNEENIIANLDIFSIQRSDEGNYVCQAENTAGLSWDNLTIHILHNDQSINEPSIEKPKTGYVAGIAIGALFGTLLALGCLFLGIFLYAQHLHSFSNNYLKKASSTENVAASSILKNNTNNSFKKLHMAKDSTYSISSNTQKKSILLNNVNDYLQNTTHLDKYNEHVEILYHQGQSMLKHVFVEPDLINEVQFESNYSMSKNYSEPFSSYPDRDGYPLNFGLPKLDSTITHAQENINYEILPHMCQHQSVLLNSSTTQHLPLSQAIKHLACTHSYKTHPVFDINYITTISTPNTNYKSTTLAPYSVLQEQVHLDAKIFDDTASINSPNIIPQPLVRPPENLEIIEHPESPDEGYVGDAMDI